MHVGVNLSCIALICHAGTHRRWTRVNDEWIQWRWLDFGEKNMNYTLMSNNLWNLKIFLLSTMQLVMVWCCVIVPKANSHCFYLFRVAGAWYMTDLAPVCSLFCRFWGRFVLTVFIGCVGAYCGSKLVQCCTLYDKATHIANKRYRTCLGKMRENWVRTSYNQIKSAIR